MVEYDSAKNMSSFNEKIKLFDKSEIVKGPQKSKTIYSKVHQINERQYYNNDKSLLGKNEKNDNTINKQTNPIIKEHHQYQDKLTTTNRLYMFNNTNETIKPQIDSSKKDIPITSKIDSINAKVDLTNQIKTTSNINRSNISSNDSQYITMRKESAHNWKTNAVDINKIKEKLSKPSNIDDNQERRRYNKMNLEKEKGFFKYRFLQNKENRSVTRKTLIKKTITNEETEKDKRLKKNSTIYHNKVEKAIFSFNLKKPEEAYEDLLSGEIIESIEEFGEFILIVPGFDKSLIGEIISKEKPPNNDLCVLNSFIRSMDFRKLSYVDALQFLFTQIIPPKDANLLLKIIDVFSIVFMEDNNNINMYKDNTALYLLTASSLALNTMLTRKDLKNNNMIKLSQFIEMNKDIDKESVTEIYNQLLIKTINTNHDYQELIYIRSAQTSKIKNKEILSENVTLELSSMNQVDHENSIINKPEIGKKLEQGNKNSGYDNQTLLKGTTFFKYRKSGKPIHRKLQLSKDKLLFELYKPNDNESYKTMTVQNLVDVFIGATNGAIFPLHNIPFDYDQNCLTIQFKTRTLDLSHDDKSIIYEWYRLIKIMIENRKKKSISLTKKKNDEIIVEEIWREEILKEWGFYRNYCKMPNMYEKKFKNKTLIGIKEKYQSIFNKTIDSSDFLFIWNYGIPKCIRKKMWPILIDNPSGISENLFNYYLQKTELIDFENLEKLENINQQEFTSDYELKLLLTDIIALTNKFRDVIENERVDRIQFMNDLFKIARVFRLSRPDVIYSKRILLIGTITLLNSEDYFDAFISLNNLVFPTSLYKFIIKDDTHIKLHMNYFNELLQSRLPKIHKYFNQLDIPPSLYFTKWFETLFVKVFPYDTLLRVWDWFLMKGQQVLYEFALVIIKIQENELLNLTVTEIIKNLNTLPLKYTEEEIFQWFEKTNITTSYEKWEKENILGGEKLKLFQTYLDETISDD